MRITLSLAVLTAAVSSARAFHQGFNYGAFFTDNSPKMQSDFEAEFKTAQNLEGAPATGFNSARLYTMIQWGTATAPISAIPAAIATNTTLLLGIWCSAGASAVTNELAALQTAIATHGPAFTDLVVGIAVGSEDLYRASPTGRAHDPSAAGLGADVLVGYINQVREAVRGTPLGGVPVGHVDTWSEWVMPGNRRVVEAVDFVGMDAYSYWEGGVVNGVEEGRLLFGQAMESTVGVAVGGKGGKGGEGRRKPVWVTETGFPVSGKTVNEAVPSAENARRFWRDVGCGLFGKVDVWWYTLRDAGKGTPEPSFGIVGEGLGKPLFDLSCGEAKGTDGDDEACDAE
ncbi:glycoside hydrolase family 17 protein [Chaetomium fimeti]|uniref:glucan endo-1,3-beta-D-glucosidase n=1 Tax=Chaetomium fimeti TaxID=1854472 RepID=A0AAE0H958_9PEZI|nr:glycoside hydrolase family 17 protein [Chaetomium fimeti]